jgi:Co/Zn/Cd efflux system component
MFLVEIGAGLAAGSASLQADALDFLGDASNYSISLVVVGMALRYRAMAALLKGATMGVFGLWVIGVTGWHVVHGTLPGAITMGAVGVAALLSNAASFGLLWAFRAGDANMRSAWVCTRNDVLGNFAVLLAALGVFGTGTGWPDEMVAAIMAALALQGAAAVIRQAAGELRTSRRGELNVPAEQVEPFFLCSYFSANGSGAPSGRIGTAMSATYGQDGITALESPQCQRTDHSLPSTAASS